MMPTMGLEESVPTTIGATPNVTYGPQYGPASATDPTYTHDMEVSGPPSTFPAQVTKRAPGEYVADYSPLPSLTFADGGLDYYTWRLHAPIVPKAIMGTGYVMRQIQRNGDTFASSEVVAAPRVPTGGMRLSAPFLQKAGT
jgi:hypothetical protein